MKIQKSDLAYDSSGFVVLADYVPHIVQEIRYYSTYNFIGERIDGYEEPCALLTKEAARALKAVSNEMIVRGYRLKVFDAYRPACAVKHFVLWGIEDQDIRMKPYFYPDLQKQELFEKGFLLTVVRFADPRPFRPRVVFRAGVGQLGHHLEL